MLIVSWNHVPRDFSTKSIFAAFTEFEIPSLSKVDVESQVASIESALNSYKQKQKPKLFIINYGDPHLVSLIVIVL